MIDLSNLYANMTTICEHAALHELEIMLRVLRNRLERLHPAVAVALSAGLELLDEEIRAKARRNSGPSCKVSGCKSPMVSPSSYCNMHR